MPDTPTLIALLHGPDQRGLVARVSGWIFSRDGNIIHADQHRDGESNVFFQRVEWAPKGASSDPGVLQAEAGAFMELAASLNMQARVALSTHRTRIALFVSKEDHCFHDLCLRWKAGELAGDPVCVISNHKDLAPAAAAYGIPFHAVHTGSAGKEAAEAEQLKICRGHGVELIVLARYMQVLSAGFLANAGVPVINIHHSFLPAFAGGRPYHQAHERGVKLIGATAHYVTAVLDDGPIIHQDVTRVTHRNDVASLIRKGRDLEKIVLAHAVRWHLENRILVYGNKTVVFD